MSAKGNAAKVAVKVADRFFTPKVVAGTVGLGIAGWNGMFGLVGDSIDKIKDDGLAGAANKIVFGSRGEDKSVAENVVDGVVGEGTFKQAKDTVHDVGRGAADMYHAVRDGLSGQPSQQLPGDQNPYQQLPDNQYSYQPDPSAKLVSDSPFGGVSDALSSILSGGKGLSIAALIPAFYLMFGHFGWMGKLSSMLLGTLAVKNLRAQQSSVVRPSLNAIPAVEQQFQQNYQKNLIAAADEDSTTLHRSRS